MRSHLHNHPWIYVPIRSRYNYEITYYIFSSHEITLQWRCWGVTIVAFAHVKLQIGTAVYRVSGPTGLAWMGFSSIKESFLPWLDIWILVVTCCSSHGLWNCHYQWWFQTSWESLSQKIWKTLFIDLWPPHICAHLHLRTCTTWTHRCMCTHRSQLLCISTRAKML